ncbi:MAG: molybdenum cofactor biosynthesis protein MoaB [Candidatus Lokiarchaeota archaeon]|nr:molybdenum cofactor biosynthesis protein MoaB [Candidatus Lokiarchaeota archaeon]
MKVHEQHKKEAPSKVNIALIIVSTSRFQEQENGEVKTDKTIPLVRDILEKNSNITLLSVSIVPDSREKIHNSLIELIKNDSLHALIFSGGTGFTPKDVTYETLEPLFEKKMDGFGEFFRYLSFKEIGPSAMLSRTTAGKIGNKIVFLLPGSPNAVKLALVELIIPEIRHIVYSINKNE